MKKKLRYVVQIIILVVFTWLMINKRMNIWLMIFGISLGAALLFGRVFCGWICPMNTMMIPAEWISKKLGIQSKKIPKIFQSRKLSYVFLILLVLTGIISKRSGLDIPFLVYLVGISILFTLRYEGSIWHSNICPFGVLQRVPGKFAKLTTKVNAEDCVGCKLCKSDCPGDAIEITFKDKKANIDSSKCLQCSNCEIICPTDAINYGKISKSIKKLA